SIGLCCYELVCLVEVTWVDVMVFEGLVEGDCVGFEMRGLDDEFEKLICGRGVWEEVVDFDRGVVYV
ncbi:hypothetical protein, partial [Bacillus altitudinis]|uniref:hypothetical protein n=1 Tax=Bacillus altitudinis TaxID=293387 RepID=UPI001C92F12F